jgi:hypothetical protein
MTYGTPMIDLAHTLAAARLEDVRRSRNGRGRSPTGRVRRAVGRGLIGFGMRLVPEQETAPSPRAPEPC